MSTAELDDVARSYLGSDASPGLLIVQGPHNSGKTTRALSSLWTLAQKKGYAGVYIMSTRLEADLLSVYFQDTHSMDLRVAVTDRPIERGALTLVDYDQFAATAKADRYLFGDYTKLLIVLDIPSAPSTEFEIAQAAIAKMLSDLSRSADKVMKLVGFVNGDSTSPRLGERLFRETTTYEMPTNKEGHISQYRRVTTATEEIALEHECIEELARRKHVICFLQRPSLIDASLTFYEQLATVAWVRLRGNPSPEHITVHPSLTMPDRDMFRFGKLVDMACQSNNRFQFEGNVGIVLTGEGTKYIGVLDPATSLVVLSSVRITCEELATQCGFADVNSRGTKIIRLLSKVEIERLAPAPPSPAYNRQITTTVLRMIDMFPGQLPCDIPFSWAHTTDKLVREVTRRLTVMGLVEYSHEPAYGGRIITARGQTALELLPLLDNNIHATSLAACAITDTDLPSAAKRVMARLAAVASLEDVACPSSDTTRAEEDGDRLLASIKQDCWGPGKRFCGLGGIWAALGLWDKARIRSNGFEQLENPTILAPVGGTVRLQMGVCKKVLRSVQLLEEKLGLEPTDELEAYKLDDAAFRRVQVHLATSFFEKLCQVATGPDRGAPFHLVGNIWVEEEASMNLIPLGVTLKGLQDLSVVENPGAIFFYRGVMKDPDDDKFYFWDATLVPLTVLTHFKNVFGGSVSQGFRSIAI